MGTIEVESGGKQRYIEPNGDAMPPLDRDEKGQWSRRDPALAISGDGTLIARANVYGVVVEKLMTGKRVAEVMDSSATLEGPGRGLAFSPDGKTLAVVRGSAGHFTLNFLDIASDRVARVGSSLAKEPYTPRFTRDGRFVIAELDSPTLFDRAGKRVATASGKGLTFVSRQGKLCKFENGEWFDDHGKIASSFDLKNESQASSAFADASGAWIAVPGGTIDGNPDGWRGSIDVLRNGDTLRIRLARVDGPMFTSPSGRWLLVQSLFCFQAIDTTR
jgi:hypothetical protein